MTEELRERIKGFVEQAPAPYPPLVVAKPVRPDVPAGALTKAQAGVGFAFGIGLARAGKGSSHVNR